MLDRVCGEEHTTTIEGILELVRKKEAAVMFSGQTDMSFLKRQATSTADARKIVSKNSSKSSKKQRVQNKEQKHCGGSQQDLCKYKDYVLQNL